MESGKRSSFDELSIAALRRFTRTPTGHRLSLRRSTTGSTSSASIKSFESERPSPCVYETTRETSSDECALHRFIVWAAVKRNACTKMTDEERRECPLLRCRQRFPNHELLLQHLYDCKEIKSGEYWCYDCGKVETFHEMNRCRRCLGHPSRRKRLMSLAKSVFSSLGRPKTTTLSHQDPDIEDEPPSYYSSVFEPPPALGFELQSNEIHEIDSSEILLPSIPEDAEAPQADYLSRSSSTSTNYTRPISVCSRQSITGSQVPVVDESLINWSPSPPMSTVSPADLMRPNVENATTKPALQLNTAAAFDYYRARSRRRSKNLQPSSSVRSTSSTTSTNSTNSTASTASCAISPMSAWSGAWGHGIGFESNLTSPADDVPHPDDAFPCSQLLPPHPEVDDTNLAFAQFMEGPTSVVGLSELPADVPADVLMAIDNVDLSQSIIPSGTALDLGPSPVATLTQENLQSEKRQSQQLIEDLKRRDQQYSNPHTLVHTARDTLDLHVSGSLDKLAQLGLDGKNHVVKEFRNLPAHSVALVGLETMSDILQGHQVQSPVKLLSFVHVVYALSLVIHEQDATNWWTDLFVQAISYNSWVPQRDRLAYVQAVDFLWKPVDMTDADFMNLLQRNAPQSSSTSSAWKGKGPAGLTDSHNDPLLFISQYFLDELENASLRNQTKPEIQTSNLCAQHMKDANLVNLQNASFTNAANYLIVSLSKQYHNAAGFVSNMRDLLGKIRANLVSTVRRLELELLQSGKMQLPPDVYFDVYVQQVRAYTDALQIQNGIQSEPRLQYHKFGIELMASIMHGSDVDTLNMDTPVPAALDFDMSEQDLQMPIDFDFDDVLVSFQPGLPTNGEPSGSGQSVEPTPGNQEPWPSSSSNSSPFSPPPTQSRTPSTPPTSGGATPANKVNADMCCDICGYRPKGDPKWFHGSMAKHKKLQHAPPKIYPCPFPGCNSQYKNRPDNLRQHQIEKGHFVDGQDGPSKGRKRKKLE